MFTTPAARLFTGLLMASSAAVLLPHTGRAAQTFNTDAVLLAPSTLHAQGESQSVPTPAATPAIKLAQAQNVPATATPDRPYVQNKAAATVDAILPDSVPAPTKGNQKKSPVDYAADTVDYDQAAKIVTLNGHVELKQDGRILSADKVVYNLKDDIATAEGHVVIKDPNGDTHYAESVELSDHMRQGLTQKLATTMADGSRAWAEKGVKESDQRYKLTDASYTACKPCAEDPTKRPPWQLHASSVEVRKDEQRIVYHNAWLDLGGVPVLYTPYFSHPDGTVQQKTGFLTPNFGWNSDLGGFFAQPYYWAISPSSDATVTVMPTTKQGPLLRGQYRQRFDRAYIEGDGSITNSSRTDSVGTTSVARGDEVRGHFFGKGGWDINRNWRAGADLQVTSDEQYLRQYGFSDDDVLENRIYAERFEGRDYALVEGLAFQDIRTSKTDQPNILPHASLSMLGNPNGLFGGRWGFDGSVLSLARDGSGQDEWRLSTDLNWQRQDIASSGMVFTTALGARTDGYVTTDRIEAATDPTQPDNKTEARFVPSAQVTASYPLKRTFKSLQLRVEPLTTLYAAPDTNNGHGIPNEDSQDVQLDAGNLLAGNRFPGLDRIEDKSHVAYGVKTGLYSDDGGYFDTFLGQSYNLYKGGNPFPAGSGLDTRSSDYIGAVNASFDEGRHMLSYRFQVDSDSMTSQRHEMYGQTHYGPVEVDGNYMYAKGVAGTTYATSREQISLGSTVDLSDAWSLRANGIYDLSDDRTQRGLRRAMTTLTYTHECYDVAVTADRNLADASSGVQDTTIMFRIGLKNLGEYSTKAFKFTQDKNGTGN